MKGFEWDNIEGFLLTWCFLCLIYFGIGIYQGIYDGGLWDTLVVFDISLLITPLIWGSFE